ncbi:RNA polymerase sigma factor [Nocardioides solisilvae]|uniref:RNA polymerase sigma factor n=1 Tax=Nocardioides solisilvae TaxID=1542435 RepID=UPI000D74DA3B|nr:RNA polymerase sigma factor [Nocardioides solisilvae]
MRRTRSAREERFRSLYADHHDPVLRFALRRTDPARADDAVAETFLVAWRRLDDVPRRPGEALPWLYTVARHCLLNAARGEGRQRAVAVRLAATRSGAGSSRAAGDPGDRLEMTEAWARLAPAEQEVLALAVWEDLTSTQAGLVLGISGAAYRVRLARARASLARHLDEAPTPVLSPVRRLAGGPRAAATPAQEGSR